MKLRVVLVAATVLLVSCVTVCGQERMRFTRYLHGYKYTFKIFDEELEKMPSWNPATEEAPISPHNAVELAEINLARLLPHVDEKWVLGDVTLDRLLNDKWVYEVEFHNNELMDSPSGPDWTFSIFVKMDGSIVEPEVVSNDGKSRVY